MPPAQKAVYTSGGERAVRGHRYRLSRRQCAESRAERHPDRRGTTGTAPDFPTGPGETRAGSVSRPIATTAGLRRLIRPICTRSLSARRARQYRTDRGREADGNTGQIEAGRQTDRQTISQIGKQTDRDG